MIQHVFADTRIWKLSLEVIILACSSVVKIWAILTSYTNIPTTKYIKGKNVKAINNDYAKNIADKHYRTETRRKRFLVIEVTTNI